MIHVPHTPSAFSKIFALLFTLLSLSPVLHAATTTETLAAVPPQNQGLPYTRSAKPQALAKIKNHLAVFAGSRYAYANGYRLRLDDTNMLHATAVEKDGKIFVPEAFAALLTLPEIAPDPAPEYLKSRWVYSIARPQVEWKADVTSLTIQNTRYICFADAARSLGKQVYQNPRGLVLAGKDEVKFTEMEANLLDSVITLFDTPEKFADATIAAKSIPLLKAQGGWKDHATFTTETTKLYDAAKTEWPTVSPERYDLTGFSQAALCSPVPAPGIYPRLLFSPEDVSGIRSGLQSSVAAQMGLIELEENLKKSWLDEKTSEGLMLKFLSTEEFSTNTLRPTCPSSIPLGLTNLALFSLLTDNNEIGLKTARAVHHSALISEQSIDSLPLRSDSEYGTSFTVALRAETAWTAMASLTRELPFMLDFSGTWMTPSERDDMRRVIAKAIYGRRAMEQSGPDGWCETNYATNGLLAMAIEGLEGCDPEQIQSVKESTRAFLDHGIDASGYLNDLTDSTGGNIQTHLLTMIALARRGENFWGHPHWRNLLQAQVLCNAPNGRMVQPLGVQTLYTLKNFFPNDLRIDYLLTLTHPGVALEKVNLTAYREKLEKEKPQQPTPQHPGPCPINFSR
ncbi:TPA: hypothetical protein DDW35_09825, partial [Candidatus Sumerlaeota bacterium]|nr:hypothetical protein [Candidatus Sumerlaeota bacterium]